jgi:pimeloyl-ACP methyl ester carboxylesterase
VTQPLLQAADLRGAARLTTDAVAGLTSLVEAMHARIATLPYLAPLGAPPRDERTSGVTGLVYETVRGVTRVVGGSAEALLGWLGPALTAPPALRQPPHPDREAVLAALNGVLGDHLAATDNPLALPMAFRHAGQALDTERFSLRSRLPGATPRLLVLLHGLCMNDLQWQRDGHDHGNALRELGFTPVYLHYNTGLSVSTNGRILAQLMERLFDAWPVPIERVVLLGHSMGGLVARSALHHAPSIQRGALRWPSRVSDLVCLGTPHQGAPLERAGHGVDVLLGATPYAAPLARLGKLRSAGIKDLRQGNIVSGSASDPGTSPGPQVDLPGAVRCFAIAGHLGPANRSDGLKAKMLGDGLVTLDSALGRHERADRRLAFPAGHQAVVHETGHLDLLASAEVASQLQRWLA